MQKYKAREINVQQKFFFSVPKKAETRSEFGAGCPKKKKTKKRQQQRFQCVESYFVVTKLSHTAYA